jgi:hypothetical protein
VVYGVDIAVTVVVGIKKLQPEAVSSRTLP